MLIIFLIGLVVSIQHQQCRTYNKGVTQGLAHTLTHSLNTIRNQVATGQISFEGSSSASNMNLMHWSQGYAKRAQTCAEKCPARLHSCNEHEHYGVMIYQRHLTSSKKTGSVLNYWFEDNHKAKQILLARQQYFGCGVASDNKIEYIVCYFDHKLDAQKLAFLGGPIGSACKLGKSKKYVGLCATSVGSWIQKQKKQVEEVAMEDVLLLNSDEFV